ncbi:MAG: cardiolipin synthase [Xanthomonadales bacterium]|nr:cardiolipin synthase [Xanthomonadales bacterium]
MLTVVLHLLIVIPCALRILLRRNRQPESRLAWLAVVVSLPFVGALAYLLVGETRVGRKRVARLREVLRTLPRAEDAPGWPHAGSASATPDRYESLFTVGESISGYAVAPGNSARLMADSDTAIDAMVADIDRATGSVHLLFYIWLDDHNGTKMVDALIRAARRGVTCRAMVDDLGSRGMVRSEAWQRMAAAGVMTRVALRVGNPLLRALSGRIDLRNHRKILVIDNRVTYCGSQNCADPAFLPKRRFAPWVDAVMRFEGPVVRQNQHLFASDWQGNGGDDLSALLLAPMPRAEPGFNAQVIATGPTYRASAMPEMFENLIYAARCELFVTTPYYVPDAALQAALCAAANRGVDTTIIFPARNDDFAVGATSRSYYRDLLAAGVKVHEFSPGILHTKSLTLDGEMTLIGSANMDRRSFDLNYENNILLHDRATTALMRQRQGEYLQSSRPILLAEVEAWGLGRRLWNNTLAILGPVL